ncbi:MAG: restriction endonuclease subunit S [Legionella sp.]|uniref:restriction endonuclease subunit S n=1 Tax=Legionella sp. TaxID=459 RepID=UPI00284AB191|nr:restriction endonuclease subunit S [Legionella sp.]
MMRYGLTEETIGKISTVLASHPSIEKAVLFGSRAKGNFKPGSDIDLSLYGETISSKELGEISSELDDLLLPYSIDLSIFKDIDHAKLREHIERVGKVFYQRANDVECQGCVVKTEWPYRALVEVCQIKPPKAEARRLLARTDLVSFVPMEYLGIDQKTLIPIQIRSLAEVCGSYTYFANGDVLLAKITPCFENGKLGIAANLTNGIGFGSSEYIVFRPDHSVDKEWLYYFLSRETFRIEGAARMSGAVGHKRISKEFIETYQIPVPPLPEQKRIVGILDKAFEGISTAKANAEKNLQNARAIFESHLQSVFSKRGKGWVERKVCEIAKHSLGKMLDKVKNQGELQPYLRNVNVRWFTFDLSDLVEMRFLSHENEKYTVTKGDVLICEGGYPGRAAIWNEEYSIYFQKALHRVRFHEPEHNKWFIYYLYSQEKSGALRRYFTGTGIQHFTGQVLNRYPIPIAPLPELRRHVEGFDEIFIETQRLESIYKKKLAALDSLKKSLLDQAFIGQL